MHAHSPAPGSCLRWLVTLCLVLSSSTALATIVAFETIEQMARRVPLIVRGQVARTVAGWDAEHRRIWTWTELVVTDVVKGEAGRVVLVKQPGGEVDGIGQRVSGAARFREGEECLLFLEAAPDEPGTWRTSGLSAGKVELRDWLGQRAALRDTDGIAFARPGVGRVEPVRSPELLGSPEDFLARLRAVIGGGR